MEALTRLVKCTDRILGTSLGTNLESWTTERKTDRRWRRATRSFPIPGNVEAEIRRILSDIGFYWTPLGKQVFLAHLILENDLKKSVEIGVYTGGSLVPQAVALKQTGGIAVGIDPYSDAAAIQKDNQEIMDRVDPALLRPDRDKMYRSLLVLLERHDLSAVCRILRMTSNDAANDVKDGMDLLHIDGNHDFDRVMDDLVNYLPKLRVGGFLVMDDIDWPTIIPLYNLVKGQMREVYESQTWGCCQKLGRRVEIHAPQMPARS